ncbi:hypothetical protein BDV93DRAFT_573848 [Ceratobasidium sp. AG-I]|nr:hypothetical protein BDV93DRAFT_573848 [Ceratobasidium sp. AG-I]
MGRLFYSEATESKATESKAEAERNLKLKGNRDQQAGGRFKKWFGIAGRSQTARTYQEWGEIFSHLIAPPSIQESWIRKSERPRGRQAGSGSIIIMPDYADVKIAVVKETKSVQKTQTEIYFDKYNGVQELKGQEAITNHETRRYKDREIQLTEPE